MTPLQRQLQELDQDIYVQRQLVKSLQSDINDTPRLKRWIEERQARIDKLVAEIEVLQRRIDSGPDLYDEALERLQSLVSKREELSSVSVRSKKAKLQAAIRAAQASGLTLEEIKGLLEC